MDIQTFVLFIGSRKVDLGENSLYVSTIHTISHKQNQVSSFGLHDQPTIQCSKVLKSSYISLIPKKNEIWVLFKYSLQEIYSSLNSWTVSVKNIEEVWYSLFSSIWVLLSARYVSYLITSASVMPFCLVNCWIWSFNLCNSATYLTLSCSIYWFSFSWRDSFSFCNFIFFFLFMKFLV